MTERLAKFIARSGVCSRRNAEELIKQKRVTVNGEIISSPAFNVNGNEKILILGLGGAGGKDARRTGTGDV